MNYYQACLLCGVEGPQIRIALVEWKEPEPDRYSAIPRCSDVEGCRSRIEAEGETWPLTEKRTAA